VKVGEVSCWVSRRSQRWSRFPTQGEGLQSINESGDVVGTELIKPPALELLSDVPLELRITPSQSKGTLAQGGLNEVAIALLR
jgi:hypothetical protein